MMMVVLLVIAGRHCSAVLQPLESVSLQQCRQVLSRWECFRGGDGAAVGGNG